MKKIFIILIVFLIMFVIFLVWKQKDSKTSQQPLAYPTLVQENPNAGALPGVRNNSSDIQKSDESFLVSQLIDKLPYKGANFSLSYSFNKNEFFVVFNQNNLSAGNNELDNYLKQNGIQDRSWLGDLIITSEPINPGP